MSAIEIVHEVIETVAVVIELAPVGVIVGGVLVLAVRRGTIRTFLRRTQRKSTTITNTNSANPCRLGSIYSSPPMLSERLHSNPHWPMLRFLAC